MVRFGESSFAAAENGLPVNFQGTLAKIQRRRFPVPFFEERYSVALNIGSVNFAHDVFCLCSLVDIA